jgi:hypothetical protein
MIECMSSSITTLGFPIVVCCYLLWERYTMIQKFTRAITDLRIEIIKLNERCKGDKKDNG